MATLAPPPDNHPADDFGRALEELHRLLPEFILVYRVDMNSSEVEYDAKGQQLSMIGAMEKVKARVFRPHLEDLT